MEGTFHRRELKLPAVSFSSSEGRQFFAESLVDGFLDGYFPLAENYITQGHPAFCGLGSLTMALNSLLVDPKRIWQGVWRWFDESMLDCCENPEVVKTQGISLAKLACLARCNGALSTLKHADTITEDIFREDIKRATNFILADVDTEHADNSRSVIICSYGRRALNQTGDGHFSPIGAYNSRRDMVLIMDVARFKYPAHWVPLSMLFAAMNTVDADAGKYRGYMVISIGDNMASTLDCCASLCVTEGSQVTLPPLEVSGKGTDSTASDAASPPTAGAADGGSINDAARQAVQDRVNMFLNHSCKNCSVSGCCSTNSA